MHAIKTQSSPSCRVVDLWTATLFFLGGEQRRQLALHSQPALIHVDAIFRMLSCTGARSFMGGDAPNLADLAVFGVTRSVTCTDTFNELMHNTGIGPWYIRMIGVVGQSSRVSAS